MNMDATGSPSYFGSKARFIKKILGTLSEHVPAALWKELVFLDAFSGGGSVSLAAKRFGFKRVIANDVSRRAGVIARAFLLNSKCQLDRSDLLFLIQALPTSGIPGRIERQFCPSVFYGPHAQLLDRCLFWSAQIQDSIKQALFQILIWHLVQDFHCFPTSLGTSNRPFAEALSGLRSWDSLNPKRFVDGSLKSLLTPTPILLEEKRKRINQGVFGGSPAEFHQQDVLDFLKGTPGEIAFLDPPYAGTLRYHQSYALLDEILFGQADSPPPSDFSSSTEALNALLDSAQHIPHWILTYGNKEIDLPGLTHLVQTHAGGRKITAIAKPHVHLRHVAKRKDNQELLILATSPEKGVF